MFSILSNSFSCVKFHVYDTGLKLILMFLSILVKEFREHLYIIQIAICLTFIELWNLWLDGTDDKQAQRTQ